MAVMLAFSSDKFSGSFAISVAVEALRIEIGFFYKHLELRIVKKCWKAGFIKICIPLPWM